jgi:hypothetical protein
MILVACDALDSKWHELLRWNPQRLQEARSYFIGRCYVTGNRTSRIVFLVRGALVVSKSVVEDLELRPK